MSEAVASMVPSPDVAEVVNEGFDDRIVFVVNVPHITGAERAQFFLFGIPFLGGGSGHRKKKKS